jgi:hypothetical protein
VIFFFLSFFLPSFLLFLSFLSSLSFLLFPFFSFFLSSFHSFILLSFLSQRLAAKVLKVVDVSYGGENGFNQAIELSGEWGWGSGCDAWAHGVSNALSVFVYIHMCVCTHSMLNFFSPPKKLCFLPHFS